MIISSEEENFDPSYICLTSRLFSHSLNNSMQGQEPGLMILSMLIGGSHLDDESSAETHWLSWLVAWLAYQQDRYKCYAIQFNLCLGLRMNFWGFKFCNAENNDIPITSKCKTKLKLKSLNYIPIKARMYIIFYMLDTWISLLQWLPKFDTIKVMLGAWNPSALSFDVLCRYNLRFKPHDIFL